MQSFYWELGGKAQELGVGARRSLSLSVQKCDHEEAEKQRGQMDLNLSTEPWSHTFLEVPFLIPFQTHPKIAVPLLPLPQVLLLLS